MRTYKGKITKELIPENGIFVFGSNTQGRHGKGAALYAKTHFGAVPGQAQGPQGRSWAIITKDLTKPVHPSVRPHEIIYGIGLLYSYAIANPGLDFYVAYSDEPNLNGYQPAAMAVMFGYYPEIPDNIIFEEEFAKLIPR